MRLTSLICATLIVCVANEPSALTLRQHVAV